VISLNESVAIPLVGISFLVRVISPQFIIGGLDSSRDVKSNLFATLTLLLLLLFPLLL
jgi:hypothetical protein